LLQRDANIARLQAGVTTHVRRAAIRATNPYGLVFGAENFQVIAVVSDISRKTSEMWGTPWFVVRTKSHRPASWER
jgi:hypothetical protein